ncbi:galactokinase [Oleidesulfovibrio sp.]|uniref:galactokinase n=1 Tax=Oleidesulfovibrio sp. TaxID=2909707 RepID=UPI003A85714D
MAATNLFTQQELIDALRQGAMDDVLAALYTPDIASAADKDVPLQRHVQQSAAAACNGMKHSSDMPAAQQANDADKATGQQLPEPAAATRSVQDQNSPANPLPYGDEANAREIVAQRIRIEQLLQQHLVTYGPRPCAIFTAPGRTELVGNHTDHNRGTVVAAAVTLDCVAAASPRSDTLVHLLSAGFDAPVAIDIADTRVHGEEKETTAAIIRGLAAGLTTSGRPAGGFDACVHSTIPVGAGLSSSAAFEVLTARIFTGLYCDEFPPAEEQARLAHSTEVTYFGKPCGEMDQIACAGDGASVIRFAVPDGKTITALPLHITASGYQLVVVNTGGSHADLTPEYAAIPHEMQAAAAVLGQKVAHGITTTQIMACAAKIRSIAGDRALLRLLHFAEETQRAENTAEAIANNDIACLLKLIRASGDSSWRLLQNCYPQTAVEQPLTVALELTRLLLCGKGAWRVHGGGFAGTIQVYVPIEDISRYTAQMEAVFGAGSVIKLSIRQHNLPVLQHVKPQDL